MQMQGIAASVDVRWRGEEMGTIHPCRAPQRVQRTGGRGGWIGAGHPISTPIAEGLDGFSGVDRRFSVRARIDAGGEEPVTIIDDYGHHPTEIKATLQAASNVWSGRRVTAIFQPTDTHEFAICLMTLCAVSTTPRK